MTKLNTNDFILHFKDRDVFETDEIVDFYRSTEDEVKPATINWRIYSFVQKGILQRVGRGKFKIGSSKTYTPEVSAKLKTLYNKVHKKFPFITMCVWHTSVFNEFMQHQAGKFYYLIEVEKESAEAVFYTLKDEHYAVLLNPSQEILTKYTPKNKDVYIVKPLISEAPVQKTDKVFTVSIEKILVDIFCDNVLFAAQQGAEMRTIFNEALSKYTVNQSKMLRYANRRKKKIAFNNYLQTISNYRQQKSKSANL